MGKSVPASLPSKRSPLGAESSARGSVASVDNKANCVAVNWRLVSAAMNASSAAVPMPCVRLSKPMTADSQARSWPA